jgi:hypothetical protein
MVPIKPTDWLCGKFSAGPFPGLPWLIDDMRSQGFLGRLVGQRCAPGLGLDPDILRWNEDAVLTALLLRVDDGPGNFVLGNQALDRALGSALTIIPSDARSHSHAALAQATLAGEQVGSSAAGEQPKFTACVEGLNGPRHVIVKFSERLDGNPVGRRWAELLICEYLASQLPGEVGHASADDELVWSKDQLFLESTRFDRPGLHGRRGVVSLAGWSDAHDGVRDSWPEAAQRMRQQEWIGADVVEQMTLRWWFGRLIGKTDMHFGNLGLFLDDARTLSLRPRKTCCRCCIDRPATAASLHVNSRHPRGCPPRLSIGAKRPPGRAPCGSAWHSPRRQVRRLRGWRRITKPGWIAFASDSAEHRSLAPAAPAPGQRVKGACDRRAAQ